MLPTAVVGTLATATVALHLRDPHVQGTWGICPTKAVLGIECPGCGGLRAVNDLTNLQLVDAISSNLVFVAAIPRARLRLRAMEPSAAGADGPGTRQNAP